MFFTNKLKALQEQAHADLILTQEEVCELMQTSLSTLYRMRKSGAGPAWIKVRGAIRYRASAVQAYLDAAEASL